jgi:hypothetical protein
MILACMLLFASANWLVGEQHGASSWVARPVDPLGLAADHDFHGWIGGAAGATRAVKRQESVRGHSPMRRRRNLDGEKPRGTLSTQQLALACVGVAARRAGEPITTSPSSCRRRGERLKLAALASAGSENGARRGVRADTDAVR